MDFGPDIASYAGQRVGLFGDSFLPLHNGHLSQIERAATQVDVLFVVVVYNETAENKLCEETGFTPISHRLRERWLSEIFASRSDIRVLAAPMPGPDRPEPGRAAAYRDIEKRCNHIDVTFGGDHERPASVNEQQSAAIRRDGALRHWDDLPEPVQRHYTKRVAFCGWESSGKSYTAEHIATILGTTCVPEYGREYYERLNSYEDIGESQDALNTMAGQLHSLERARGYKVLCLDTDLIYTQFYHLKDFGWMHPALDALIRADAEKIDEWIFLEPRNPLADDGSRFRYDDDERQRTSDALQDLYREYGCRLHVVDEDDDARRLTVCTELVRSFME